MSRERRNTNFSILTVKCKARAIGRCYREDNFIHVRETFDTWWCPTLRQTVSRKQYVDLHHWKHERKSRKLVTDLDYITYMLPTEIHR